MAAANACCLPPINLWRTRNGVPMDARCSSPRTCRVCGWWKPTARIARPLRAQTPQEWITHEAWLSNDEIIFTYWPHALKAIRRDGSGERNVAAFNCWHPAPRRDGAQIVCDTTLPDRGTATHRSDNRRPRDSLPPASLFARLPMGGTGTVCRRDRARRRLRTAVVAPPPVVHPRRPRRGLHLRHIGTCAGLPGIRSFLR